MKAIKAVKSTLNNVMNVLNKPIFRITDSFDDPVGNWWLCNSCNNKVFIPIFDIKGNKIEQIKYCPYCGEIITSFNKIEICMDDSIIGTDLNKIV